MTAITSSLFPRETRMPVLLNPRYELFAQGLALGKKQDIAYADAGYTKNKGNSSTLKNKPGKSKPSAGTA